MTSEVDARHFIAQFRRRHWLAVLITRFEQVVVPLAAFLACLGQADDQLAVIVVKQAVLTQMAQDSFARCRQPFECSRWSEKLRQLNAGTRIAARSARLFGRWLR